MADLPSGNGPTQQHENRSSLEDAAQTPTRELDRDRRAAQQGVHLTPGSTAQQHQDRAVQRQTADAERLQAGEGSGRRVCNLNNCLSSATGARMVISQTGHNHDVHLFVLQTHPAHRQQQQQMSPGGSSSLYSACKRPQTPCWQQLETGAGPKTQQPASAAGSHSPSNANRKLQPVDRAAGLLQQVRNVLQCCVLVTPYQCVCLC
jgi:hypothetical protein